MSKALLFNEYSVNSFLFIKFLQSDRVIGLSKDIPRL